MRQYPVAGSYRGPARIAESEKVRNGLFQVPRTNIGPHIMAQPVIDVSGDGHSARYRTRNFQLGSSIDRPGNVAGGSYANNQAVLVNGVWKIWSIAIDEFYWQGDLVNGWSKWKPRPQGQTKLDTDYLPEISRRVLGKREEGIAGGPGQDHRVPGHQADVVLLQESGEWPRAPALLARLRHPQLRSLHQHDSQRLLTGAAWRSCLGCD